MRFKIETGRVEALALVSEQATQCATNAKAPLPHACEAERLRSPSTVFAAMCLAALIVSGCAGSDDDAEMAPTGEAEARPVAILSSDVLRFYLDTNELERGNARCFEGMCTITTEDRLLPVYPFDIEDFVPVGLGTPVDTGTSITLLDVSLTPQDLPDYPGAEERATYGYAAWGENIALNTLVFDYVRKGRPQQLLGAAALGWRSEGNPVGGTASWSGILIGADYSVIGAASPVLGNANLRMDIARALLNVDFTNIENQESGAPYADMFWRYLPVRGGAFETFNLSGRFFGENHEEVAGVFDRNQIIGAFGAAREAPEE